MISLSQLLVLATFPTLALASIRTLGRRNRMKVKCLRQSHFPAGTHNKTFSTSDYLRLCREQYRTVGSRRRWRRVWQYPIPWRL